MILRQKLLNKVKNHQDLFLIFFLGSILIYHSAVIFTSGDGGELVTAVYSFGVAHPSGYPLYLILGKFFTLIPIGNVASRLALMSITFSLLSVFVIKNILKDFFEIELEFIYTAIFLLVFSYSFFNQSIIDKFYTLNSFLILSTIYYIFVSNYNYSKRSPFILAFLYTLCMSNHHTSIFLALPIFFVIIKNSKNKIYDLLAFMLVVVSVIGLVYTYFIIRSHSNSLFIFQKIENYHDLLKYFFRMNYGKGSSIEIAKSTLNTSYWEKIYYGFRNLIFLLNKEFSFYCFIPMLAGIIKIRNNLIMIVLFLSYCVILPSLVFSQKELNAVDLYIAGHQYFLPTFALFVMLVAIGLKEIWIFFNDIIHHHLTIIKKVFPVIPLLFLLPFRTVDSNYQNNWVLYYQGIDSLFVKKFNAFYVLNGDNTINRTLYLKNIENFRDDICGITYSLKNDYGISYFCPLERFRLLNPKYNIVKKTKGRKNFFIILVPNNRAKYSNQKKISIFKTTSLYNVMDYFYLSDNITSLSDMQQYVKQEREKKAFLPLTHYKWCFYDKTDDYFTTVMCSQYVYFLAYYMKDNMGESGKRKFTLRLSNDNISFYINKNNIKYLKDTLSLIKICKMKFYLVSDENK